MLDAEIKNKLWNKFWSGGISNPLNAREQNAKLVGEKVSSIFPKKEYKWSVWTEYPAEQMREQVRDEVFPFLRKLNGGENSIYSKYMKNENASMVFS